MNASHEVEARASCEHHRKRYGFNRWCLDCWRAHARYVERELATYSREWDELPKTGTTRRAGLPVAYLEGLANDRRARGTRASPGARIDADVFNTVVLGDRVPLAQRPPGLAGPREFAVPAGQLAGLRYHVMVRGCV